LAVHLQKPLPNWEGLYYLGKTDNCRLINPDYATGCK
jgi:hypothetical protein